MTWRSSRRELWAVLLLWMLIAVVWTLLVLGVLPTGDRMQGFVPWFAFATSWMVVILWGSKLRQLPRRSPEEQTNSKAD
jgi:hypothetical protein